MQFLKKEIFYPDNSITGESNLKIKMQEARNAYQKYIGENKELFPKNLYSAYMKSDFFHDYAVKSIKIEGDAWCYWKKSDIVTLEIRNNNQNEYTIVFEKISYLKLLNEQRDSCWVGNCSPTNGLEEIVLSEIRIIGDKKFAFEFLTSSGAIFEINFKSIKIEKRTIYH